MRWFSFNSVGILGIGVQIATLWALTEWLGLHYLVATGLAVETTIIHNFVWHDRWTWRDRSPARGVGRWKRLAQFNVVNGLLAITGQLVFTGLYVKVFDIHYALANLLAIVSCSVLSFVVNDRLVFRAGTSPILELATLGETPCNARHAERR